MQLEVVLCYGTLRFAVAEYWGLTFELTGPLRWAGIWVRLLNPNGGPPQWVRLSEWLGGTGWSGYI